MCRPFPQPIGIARPDARQAVEGIGGPFSPA
jgi:hypothetical protein